MQVSRALGGRSVSACSLLPRGVRGRLVASLVFACAASSTAAFASADAGVAEADAGTPAAEFEAVAVDIVETPLLGSGRAPAAQATIVETSRYGGEVRSVAQLLATSPGVSIHTLGGPGQAATVSLRGATADESLVLLDGIPLAGPGGGAIDLSTIPAGLLDRAVVSRGVLGAQLGSGALGGVIELLPRGPNKDGPHGGAEASAGSFGTVQLAADVSSPLGASGGLVGAAQLERTGGAFDYQRQLTPELAGAPYYDEVRANDDARRAAALLRWSTQLSGGIEASALAQASAGIRGLPGPIGGFTPHARAEDASWVAGGRLQGSIGEGVWTARAWARGSWLQLRGLQLLAGDCLPGDPGCPTTANRSLASRAEGELRLPVGDRQWVSALISAGGEGVSGAGVGLRRRALASLALADDVRFFQGRLSVHPAVRLDQVGDATGLSPGIAVLGRPFDEHAALGPLELRSGLGWSFRAPSLAELYLDQGSITPNPGLRPERAWSLDAGLAWRTERVTLSLGAFWSSYRDLILYEQNPPARIKAFNIGAARIAGLEARAVLTLPHGLLAEASYSYLEAINRRASQTEGGQTLPYRPPHRLFLRGAYRGDRFEGYSELDAISSMPRNQFGTAYLPARAILSAGAGVRAVGPLWIDLEARNLLDDRTQQDLFQYPLPGFSLAAIARARL